MTSPSKAPGPSQPSEIHSVEALILPEVCETIRAHIAEIQGAEVFFVARLDADLCVEEAEPYAFGNARSVPAIIQYARPGDVIIHNHPSGNLEPSEADINISSALGESGIGSYIINNDCTRARVVVRAMRPRGIASVDPDDLVRMLSPGGRLAEGLDRYERRPQQIEMLRSVSRAFNENGVAVIEAGTGTGKSLAYLLPALAWSINNKEKVVIATHTINLQEQIIEKDLPLLRQALDMEFDAVLVKGRGNYLSRRKADYARVHPDFTLAPEKRAQLETVLEWTKVTRDGSLSDLSFTPDHDVWDQVISESDNCMRTKCPYYQSCFFYQARRRAARAQIIVANHHLLMSDLAVRSETENYTMSAVLPVFHRIIFDEAHHIEEVATSYFGAQVSRVSMVFLLRRLWTTRTGEGVLRQISLRVQEGVYALPDEVRQTLAYELGSELVIGVQELQDSVEEACDRAAIYLDETSGGPIDQGGELKLRVTPQVAHSPAWQSSILTPLRSSLASGGNLIAKLRRLSKTLSDSIEEETPENMSPLLELNSAIGKLEHRLKQIMRFLDEDSGDCRWIEYRRPGAGRRKGQVTFCSAPLDVSSELREKVFRRFRTVVLTSATLTVERRFKFFLERIGADNPAKMTLQSSHLLEDAAAGVKVGPGKPRRVETLQLDAPFDYENQVYVAAPIDLPTPKEPGFAEALANFIVEALRISRGRAFVLFTSYATLERVHRLAAPRIEAMGYPCLKQGGTSRSMLIEAFRREIGSTLFATSSFWEGVDVPGEALSVLILTRLPFSVPGEPIVEARVEALKAQGLDPFQHFIVPRAVIRFRQGFGRLIRTASDRGAALICDKRIATTGYGRVFLRSLPTEHIDVTRSDRVFERLEAFFSDEAAENDDGYYGGDDGADDSPETRDYGAPPPDDDDPDYES